MSYPRFSFQQSVLFIDDQSKFENLIRNGLLGLNAQYEFCPSRVSAAVERLEAETPDLIVSTLEFKEGNVIDFVGKHREFLAQVPSIYLSEPHTVDLEAELAKLGEFNVMERRRDPLELIRKMAQLIAESIDKPKPRLKLVSSRTEEQVRQHRQAAGIAPVNWAEEILKRNS
jgi:DNA-binding NtrC family response regulator